jgi:hypothetical protein
MTRTKTDVRQTIKLPENSTLLALLQAQDEKWWAQTIRTIWRTSQCEPLLISPEQLIEYFSAKRSVRISISSIDNLQEVREKLAPRVLGLYIFLYLEATCLNKTKRSDPTLLRQVPGLVLEPKPTEGNGSTMGNEGAECDDSELDTSEFYT